MAKIDFSLATTNDECSNDAEDFSSFVDDVCELLPDHVSVSVDVIDDWHRSTNACQSQRHQNVFMALWDAYVTNRNTEEAATLVCTVIGV
jgi:hypothetical protein